MKLTCLFLSAALGAAWLTTGCSNPADDSTAAVVTDAVALPADPTDAAVETTAATTEGSATSLPLLSAASTIAFVGSKVTGSHEGGFKAFEGTVELGSDSPSVTGIKAVIDMDSTWSDNDKLTGHLKAPDFFDVAKFPKAEFISTSITEGGEKGASHTITGNFTLHGVTKSISFPATIQVEDGSATITSDFFINRKDFGIEYSGKTDDLIRDEVVIKLALKAGA